MTPSIQPPKVLHIITGLGDGGAEGALYRLCCHGDALPSSVISLTDIGKYGTLLRDKGIKVTCLNMPRGRVTLRGLWTLWRSIRSSRAQVIQTWMYHADLLGGVFAILAGKRRIFWGIRHTTLDSASSPRSTLVVARLCARLSHFLPRAVICCAESARRSHIALGYRSDRMRVVHNGVDLSHLAPDPEAGAALRRELGLADDLLVLGCVARFDPQKDHPNLLKALALLKVWQPRFRCLLVGTGIDEGNHALQQTIAALGLKEHVSLLGRRDDIPRVMNALDIHLLASSSEAFPNVVAEAMACGTPCVASDAGDAAEIVGPTGKIVPPRDAQAFADAIAVLAEERRTTAWDKRCRAARERVQNQFTLAQMVRRFREVWLEDQGQTERPRRHD